MGERVGLLPLILGVLRYRVGHWEPAKFMIPIVMYHDQECCELVQVVDITGDLNDLVGARILVATEATNDKDPV